MDGERFDDLVRWLETAWSRRTLTNLLGGGVLVASLAGFALGDTAAKGKHKGKGKGKRKKPVCVCSPSGCTQQKVTKPATLINQNLRCNYAGECTSNPCATPPPGEQLPPGTPQVAPPAVVPATCSDGILNGNESDVDCGGPDCLRCINGQSCNSLDDCSSAFCWNQAGQLETVCTPCNVAASECFNRRESCFCGGTIGACLEYPPDQVSSCTDCPPYAYCNTYPGKGTFCYRLCGT